MAPATRLPSTTREWERARSRRGAEWQGAEWWIAGGMLAMVFGLIALMARPRMRADRPFTGTWRCTDDPRTMFEIDPDGTYDVVTPGDAIGGIWTESSPSPKARSGTLRLREEEDCLLPCHGPPTPIAWSLNADGSILTLRMGGGVWLRGRREPTGVP